ncbi:LD-carboxypeptidase family protein [Lyngbya aestuarii BL J]|uniref:LD-carboxypeptidase family protein n=1 Tax=Lyngbya aestuarii BL J TaxID=1348334 RepID=U7QL74_9CYAN|nr:LD-carboxypeptidase [Lyngbya aestuarii]ERT07860.1 LD-carboxypeptidase family protein [Lyngbya aestuarii BL J]
MNRRQFLSRFGHSLLLTQFSPISPITANSSPKILKPSRLKIGDTVGLVTPASPIKKSHIKFIQLQLAQQGLKIKVAPHALDEYGYLAGVDRDRAADINAFFADGSVQALISTGGGWGSSRILPFLDYDLIRRNPKIILGYSDITALLVAIYSRSGLTTFHGLLGTSVWNEFSVAYLRRLLFNAEAITFQNPAEVRVETITPGQARGRLVGGNLSVIGGLVGSGFLPDWNQAILFVEDVGEDIYRVDRMLNHLRLAGILEQLGGFIFGQCTRCLDEEDDSPTLSLWQVLNDHIRPLGIPAWYGSMIGHIRNQFTVPLGVEVEIDANLGIIKMLESAVI